ncbi:MAG TPA: hypothetical protein VF950_23255, partial [Planctomycetota bacterium]
RLHLRFGVPEDIDGLRLLEARAEAQGKSVAVAAPALALERRGDLQTAHVLLRAPKLAVEDLFITLRLKID